MTIEQLQAVTNYKTAERAAKASFRVSLSSYVGIEIVDVQGYVVGGHPLLGYDVLDHLDGEVNR